MKNFTKWLMIVVLLIQSVMPGYAYHYTEVELIGAISKYLDEMDRKEVIHHGEVENTETGVEEQPIESEGESSSPISNEENIEESSEEPTEETTEEPTEEITEEPTEETTEEPTEEITEEPTEEITEEPTEEITEEPTEEITEEPIEETPEETNETSEEETLLLEDISLTPFASPAQSFTFTIRGTYYKGEFIVPTNGRTSTGAYGQPYSWEIFLDNKGSQGIFEGTSSDSINTGPVLTGISGGTHIIKIVPTTEDRGWLRAFGGNNHPSMQKIIGIGSSENPVALPYKGIASETGDDYVGYYMFNGTNLASITGTILSIADDSDWAEVTTIGSNFFNYAFYGNKLESLASGSFDTSNITTVGNNFFDLAFYNNKNLTSLPEGSFNTSKITTVGNNFFDLAFYNNKNLTSLPEGSFNTSNISGTVGDGFFNFAFSYSQLTSLPEGSFDTSNISGTVGDDFFYLAFSYNDLTSLPLGSFNTSKITTVGRDFFGQVFLDNDLTSLPLGSFNTSQISGTVGNGFFAHAFRENQLTSLPEGSFDTSKITTVESDFFDSTFSGNQLTRESIIQVASKWNLKEENLKKSNVFNKTFYNNPTSGVVTEEDIPQLADNPNALKNTFSGTNLKTTSANYENWGLEYTAPLPQSFTFTINQTSTGNFIVPTNGRTSTGAYGQPYSWRISLDGVPQGTFVGKSSKSGTAGLVLTGVSAGTHTIQIVPTAEDRGWLKAFGTYGDEWTHTSASKIIGIGSSENPVALPYKGIAQSETNNDYAGCNMFNSANLASITGSILSIVDDSDWEKVATVGNYFFQGAFGKNQLTSLPEGSFNTSKITTVGTNFFVDTFNSNKLTSLATGSFNTSNISGTVGNNFFSNAFYYNQLENLPEGSFDTSKITTVGTNFFSNAFYYNQLENLPEGSFNTSNISGTVGNNFFDHAFYGSTNQLTSLPEGSFDTSKITTVGNDFFSYAFSRNNLRSLPSGSFDTSNISGTVGNNFFNHAFHHNYLRSLPEESFDTSKITTVRNNFFSSAFYMNQSLRSLPSGSFDTSNISGTVGNNFFNLAFHKDQLTSLPEGSFDTSKITTVGNDFFYNAFQENKLESLATGSFDTSNITTVGNNFFYFAFNKNQLTSLVTGSFNTNQISGTVGDGFFYNAFSSNQLRSLPTGSFNTSNITTVGNNFFYFAFSSNQLTSLATGSFDTNQISGTVGDGFFNQAFSSNQLTSLPEGSFDTSNISGTVGNNFFANAFSRNSNLTGLPVGSFDTSKITTVGTNFFAETFYYNQLTRESIIQVASKRKLDQENLDKSKVFSYTFYNNPTSGMVTKTDIPQLAYNPNTARKTFSSTNLKTTSANYANWGLIMLPSPTASLTYTPSAGTRTSGNVTVTLTASEPIFQPLGRSGSSTGEVFTRVFSANTGYNFIITNLSNLTGMVAVNISNIDTEAPSLAIQMTPMTLTGGDVTVTLDATDNESGLPTEAYSFDGGISRGTGKSNNYMTNQSGILVAVRDAVGNIHTGSVTISNIDKTPPTAKNVTYAPSGKTNQDVKVTITIDESVQNIPGRTGGTTTRTKSYAGNTSGIVEFYDLVGNKGSTGIVITWIDKTPVIGTISYSITGATNQTVTATISFNKTGVTITNNGGSASYLFTENGSFTFEFKDEAGNSGSETATVSWITARPSGGGGETILKRDSCPNGDYSPSYYDGACNSENDHASAEENEDSSQAQNNQNENSSQAQNNQRDLYDWAKEYQLTNKQTYEEARLEDGITRAEMAKVIVSYMDSPVYTNSSFGTRYSEERGETLAELNDKESLLNEIFSETKKGTLIDKDSSPAVLQGRNDKRTAHNDKCSSFTDLNQVNAELQSYIIKACEYGLMGYYSNGETTKEYFSPTEEITRAEVATIISRMLRGNTYKGTEEEWYQNHLLALRKEDIIQTDRNPMEIELRGYVFLMLYRVAGMHI